jgi:predicted RNA-binding Zn-ribbon protein involved in translation (DUF1610 family)
MPSILDSYKAQLEKDRENESYDENLKSSYTEEEYKQYQEAVDNLREQIYVDIPEEMSTKIESKTYPRSLVEETNEQPSNEESYPNQIKLSDKFLRKATGVDERYEKKYFTEDKLETTKEFIQNTFEEYYSIHIVHAKCPYCGEEIISENPTLFNPLNLKATNPHTCKRCGNEFMTEKAYPRIAMFNANNEEITVHFN